jgi:hypothetical protein
VAIHQKRYQSQVGEVLSQSKEFIIQSQEFLIFVTACRRFAAQPLLALELIGVSLEN